MVLADPYIHSGSVMYRQIGPMASQNRHMAGWRRFATRVFSAVGAGQISEKNRFFFQE